MSRLSGEVKTLRLIWRRPRFDFLAAGAAACRGLSVVKMEERLISRYVDTDGSGDSIENHFANVLRHQKLSVAAAKIRRLFMSLAIFVC